MLEKDKLHTALHYSSLGKMQIASEIFWDVYLTTKNIKLKLQTILALVATLNHLKDNSKIKKICSEGIIFANGLGDYDSKAYLLVCF